MISISQAQAYCRDDITLIKNYAKAVADTTQTWICHHIHGEPVTGLCKADLKKMNMYYQRPASELMFVTRKMHEDIHGSCKKAGKRDKSGSKNSFYGKHHSEESKARMSESHKNMSDTTRAKLSAAKKGKKLILCADGKRHYVEVANATCKFN